MKRVSTAVLLFISSAIVVWTDYGLAAPLCIEGTFDLPFARSSLKTPPSEDKNLPKLKIAFWLKQLPGATFRFKTQLLNPTELIELIDGAKKISEIPNGFEPDDLVLNSWTNTHGLVTSAGNTPFASTIIGTNSSAEDITRGNKPLAIDLGIVLKDLKPDYDGFYHLGIDYFGFRARNGVASDCKN